MHTYPFPIHRSLSWSIAWISALIRQVNASTFFVHRIHTKSTHIPNVPNIEVGRTHQAQWGSCNNFPHFSQICSCHAVGLVDTRAMHFRVHSNCNKTEGKKMQRKSKASNLFQRSIEGWFFNVSKTNTHSDMSVKGNYINGRTFAFGDLAGKHLNGQ